MFSAVWRFVSAPFRLIPWYVWLGLVAIGAWFGRNFLLIVATIFAFHPIPMPPLFQGEPETLAESQLQDIEHFANHVPRLERSIDDATREAMHARLEAMEARAGEMTPAEFQLELARVQAMIDNGHSNASATRMTVRTDSVPLRLTWMVDELRVLRVRPGFEDLLGARVTEINGEPVEAVIARFRDAFGGNDAFFLSFAPLFLEAPDYLAAVGLADPVYSLELMNGDTVERSFEARAPESGDRRRYSGDLPQPWIVDSDSWVAFEPQGDPLFLRHPGRDYWFERLPGRDAVYMALRSNLDDDSGETLVEFVNRAQEELRALAPLTIIVDQRFNGGGDLTRTAPLMQALGDIVGPDGQVYLLASGNTFSAGIVNLAMTKEAAPDQTILVGEPIGDRLQFWAEGMWYSLPNSNFRARYSTGFYDLQNGCEGVFVCHWGSLHIFPVLVDDLDIDLGAPMTFEAYAAGRDPALEAIGLQ